MDRLPTERDTLSPSMNDALLLTAAFIAKNCPPEPLSTSNRAPSANLSDDSCVNVAPLARRYTPLLTSSSPVVPDTVLLCTYTLLALWGSHSMPAVPSNCATMPNDGIFAPTNRILAGCPSGLDIFSIAPDENNNFARFTFVIFWSCPLSSM